MMTNTEEVKTPKAVQPLPTKERITIRIDKDILEYFRSMSGPNARGYQSRINQALREYMLNGIESTEEILRKVMREELKRLHGEDASLPAEEAVEA